MGKKAILLINLGTPEAPTRGAVYDYLKEFLLDKRVIDINAVARNLLVRGLIAPFRSGESSKIYKKVWTPEGSPLKVYGFQLRDMLQEKVGEEYIVELAMRYQTPSVESVIKKLLDQDITEITVFPLFPQYASATTGSVHEEVMRIISKEQIIPQMTFVNSYYNHPAFINAFVERSKEYNIDDYDHVLFSYHGLPKRQLVKADKCNHCQQTEDCCHSISDKNRNCYSAQCYGTTTALVKELGLNPEQYTTCFQSRLGRDPWLEPYTSDILKVRADKGDKKLLVFCPAFVADCLETTVEISEEYGEEFEELGGEHVQLVESLNAQAYWVDGLHAILQDYNVD